MNTNEVVDLIVNIPHNFRTQKNKSVYALLSESGYFEKAEAIDEGILETRLNDDIVSEWLRYSEDKRTSSGWYFHSTGRGFSVGTVSPHARKNLVDFADSVSACAYFIKNEIESIRID